MLPCGGTNLRRAASPGPDREEWVSAEAEGSGREPGRGRHSAWGINNPAKPGDGIKREDSEEGGWGVFSMGKEDEMASVKRPYQIS